MNWSVDLNLIPSLIRDKCPLTLCHAKSLSIKPIRLLSRLSLITGSSITYLYILGTTGHWTDKMITKQEQAIKVMRFS